MKNITLYINEVLSLGGNKDRDKNIDELYNTVKEFARKSIRTDIVGIVQTTDYSDIYIIYPSIYGGYKGAMYDLENKKLSNYYKPTNSYATVEEVKKFIEKNWSFNKNTDQWYWGRNENKERNTAPKSPEKKKPVTVGDTDLTQCKNAEEIITKLAEYLGLNKYDISSTILTRYKAQIKGKMLQYRNTEIIIYDGTYQASHSIKGYLRKKGFTVRINIKDKYGYDHTDLDYRLGPQGDDFIDSFGRWEATIKSLAERIDKIIDNAK